MDKIQTVTPCTKVAQCFADPGSYKSKFTSTWSTPSAKMIASRASQALEDAWKEDQATHEDNLTAIEANRAIIERIKALMGDVGMPTSYREVDRRSRARFPKYNTHDAGYLEDIRRHIKVSDGFDLQRANYEKLKARYDAYAAEANSADEKEKAAKLAAAEAEKLARRKNIELAKIILRYGFDEDISWGDVVERLRERDQRLDLAVAMQLTRGDWSDGFYRVRDAFGRFRIETDEDKEIANCIAGCLSDEDDGRVFRDCQWNYDRLFSSVADQQLAADAQTAISHWEY